MRYINSEDFKARIALIEAGITQLTIAVNVDILTRHGEFSADKAKEILKESFNDYRTFVASTYETLHKKEEF